MPPVTAGKERKRMAAFPGYEELIWTSSENTAIT
jgi:hypothetical protein